MGRAARGKIVRHLLALANTKGGYIVIGVGEDEDGTPTLYTGLNEAEAKSFDPSAVGSFVNSHVEPPIDFTIERPLVRGRRYAIFHVRPFGTMPHVCSRAVELELQPGVFYIRTPDASSRPAHRAIEMQAIIQRALRNQREMLGRMLRGILYESRPGTASGKAGFDDAVAGAVLYFRHRHTPPAGRKNILVQFTAHPEKAPTDPFDPAVLHHAAANAWRYRPGAVFIGDGELERAKLTNVSLRAMPRGSNRMWQLFNSGLFHYIGYLPLPEGRLELETLLDFTGEAVNFVGRVYSELDFCDELFLLSLELDELDGVTLHVPRIRERLTASASRIEGVIHRSAADLLSGCENHAAALVRKITDGFGLSGRRFARWPELIKSHLDE